MPGDPRPPIDVNARPVGATTPAMAYAVDLKLQLDRIEQNQIELGNVVNALIEAFEKQNQQARVNRDVGDFVGGLLGLPRFKPRRKK